MFFVISSVFSGRGFSFIFGFFKTQPERKDYYFFSGRPFCDFSPRYPC
ncbi:MAG: hypothetical protein COY85_03790, partial [Candidatus Portnoybacteria bacterium CG_4_10_14_0_8_um_filter_40_50]